MTSTAPGPLTEEHIRARLDEIAPLPQQDTPDFAAAFSRVVAVDAQRMVHRMWTVPAYRMEWDDDAKRLWVNSIHVEATGFAVVHLLAALANLSPEAAEEAARQCSDAWDDGAGVAEWLWEHCRALGIDTDEVNRLEDARLALESKPGVTGTPDAIEGLQKLAWDMLNTMPASAEALSFAVRAGQLGVCDPAGNPLIPACAKGDPSTTALAFEEDAEADEIAREDDPEEAAIDAEAATLIASPPVPTVAELGGEKFADYPAERDF